MTATTDAPVITALQAELARIQAELTQRDQELETLRTVIDSLPYAAFWKDMHGSYTGANQRFVADLGFAAAADVLGKSDADLPWQPGEAALFQVADARVLAQGQTEYDDSETVVYPDGRQEWFETYRIPLRSASGALVGILTTYNNITQRRSAETTVLAQAHQLHELSTPLIPLSDHVLLMPLIGAIDTARAQHMLEVLLAGLAAHHAQCAIVDITGVLVVDTQVAAALIRAAHAARLLGARVILTGMRPDVAQTLVGIGVDLTDIVTLSTIQSGIAYALRGDAF